MKISKKAKSTLVDSNGVVKIKTSQLPNAGKGLFALVEFKRGDIVCEYEGEIVTWAECERRSNEGHEGYAFFMTNNLCVDAYFTPWAFGRYANDARGVGRVNGLRNNAQYEIKRRDGVQKVFIVATRTIQPGQEVFVHYGDDYWRYLDGTREIILERERQKRKENKLKKLAVENRSPLKNGHSKTTPKKLKKELEFA
ncbi:MAG: SET domain-containing protein-lysine N-methyltransferase [Bacteroidetes bacterium]|nr:SET domain-containing protein-lysine N-methyltransferase [Bacteroidota bacterium]